MNAPRQKSPSHDNIAYNPNSFAFVHYTPNRQHPLYILEQLVPIQDEPVKTTDWYSEGSKGRRLRFA